MQDDTITEVDDQPHTTNELEKTLLTYAILAVITIVVSFLWLEVRAAQERARRADCADNLRQLGLGLHMYSGDNREKFPEDLKAVMPYIKHTELLACPSSKQDIIGRPYPHEVNRYGSYYYIAGLTEAADSDRLHMFDLPSNHKGEGGNILYVGGYIQWCDSRPEDGSLGFWEVLEENGITWDLIKKTKGRIIQAERLHSPDVTQ